LTTCRASINLPGKYMTKETDAAIRQYLSLMASKGGKARAKKYDKTTLSKWAKKGGRPKGSGGKEK
jgi:hypothetical protein